MAGSQDYAPDPRNASLLVYLNGALVPRDEARVSIFDAGFGLGDGIWEGIRLHKGQLLFLDAHLDRLFAGAAAISLDIGRTRTQIAEALRATCTANFMQDGVHLRLMVTRGLKSTINQDPRTAIGPPTLAITAEHKRRAALDKLPGLALHTTHIRCSPATMFDMRLNSHSRLNLILALLDAIEHGADEALMLDPNGAVSSCNATNFFAVRNGTVLTSDGEFCFNGITRGHIMSLCRANGVPLRIGPFTLAEAHGAQEAFVTGTLGGVTPVGRIDSHPLDETAGPVTRKLAALYAELMDRTEAGEA